jgi:hypothetical protein
MKRLYDAFQLVKQNLERARSQQKQQYDKRAKNLDYLVGDRVLLDVRTVKHGTSKKLNPRFQGPYRISKVHNNHTVEIQPTTGGSMQLVHVNRIKPLLESMIWKDDPCPQFEDLRIIDQDSESVAISPQEEDRSEDREDIKTHEESEVLNDTMQMDGGNSMEPFYGFPVAPPRRKRKNQTFDLEQRAERPPGLRPWSKITPREF